MSIGDGGPRGLDQGISDALDCILVPGAGGAALLARLRKLVENCLADNYADTDVRAVIELAMASDEEGAGGA